MRAHSFSFSHLLAFQGKLTGLFGTSALMPWVVQLTYESAVLLLEQNILVGRTLAHLLLNGRSAPPQFHKRIVLRIRSSGDGVTIVEQQLVLLRALLLNTITEELGGGRRRRILCSLVPGVLFPRLTLFINVFGWFHAFIKIIENNRATRS